MSDDTKVNYAISGEVILNPKSIEPDRLNSVFAEHRALAETLGLSPNGVGISRKKAGKNEPNFEVRLYFPTRTMAESAQEKLKSQH